ncbi:MAG: hypothetical protein WCC41_01660 [Rhodomicrobium sp.]
MIENEGANEGFVTGNLQTAKLRLFRGDGERLRVAFEWRQAGKLVYSGYY